jgi:hypothetical protein
MSDTLLYLDQALDVGMRELECLVSGEVEEAERLAAERGRLIGLLTEHNPRPEVVDFLREKLLKLQSLQGQLTNEAKKLHAKLKEDLKRTKLENKRLCGYGTSVRGGRIESRFITKTS